MRANKPKNKSEQKLADRCSVDRFGLRRVIAGVHPQRFPMWYCAGVVVLAMACVLGCSNPNPSMRPMTEAEALAILDEADDFQLPNRVFCGAADLTNNKVDFDSESEPLKTVSMVWLASGVVDNGGFGYLLEYQCGNDRELRQIAGAFRRINAHICAQAFDEMFAMFPGGVVIHDYDAKIAHYRSVPDETRDQVDSRFYSQSDTIHILLAKFIRENRDGILRELTR